VTDVLTVANLRIVPILLGPFIGSFLGVLIVRLPATRPIVWSRSVCETCRRQLSPLELIPLLSFAALRGRCRTCESPIGAFPFAVEIAATVIATWAVVSGSELRDVWLDSALGWTLLTLAWIDWDHMQLPDVLTLPLLLFGLMAALVFAPLTLPERVLGAAAGYLAFVGTAWAYHRLRKRDGLGAGDAKLLAASGAWIGWGLLLDVVIIAAICCLGSAAYLQLRGRTLTRHTALPFGPFLAFATWVVWLYGPILSSVSLGGD
jgi:leader peptidase (prepilin peptidase)/N-methyltransferase